MIVKLIIEFSQIQDIRGRRSRNKVSVDESADGSLKRENEIDNLKNFIKI
jgi:hypothetical protein